VHDAVCSIVFREHDALRLPADEGLEPYAITLQGRPSLPYEADALHIIESVFLREVRNVVSSKSFGFAKLPGRDAAKFLVRTTLDAMVDHGRSAEGNFS